MDDKIQKKFLIPVERKIAQLKEKYGHDKELLKLKLFSLSLKLMPGAMEQKRVKEEIDKLKSNKLASELFKIAKELMAAPHYKAPNKRIIPRSNGGQFSKPEALGAEICPHCHHFVLPETKNVGSESFPFLKTGIPENCPNCGKSLK